MNFKGIWQKKRRYDLSVIVIFYNMRREAQRTLLSLTDAYQLHAREISYEVIAIDNGSTAPLDAAMVEGFGKNFRYVYYDTKTASPSAALNYGVQIAQGTLITVCIDGARILSPGILYHSMLASKVHSKPFIYTLGMHIGHKLQNYLVEENYSQADEDVLISSVNWKQDGYLLFDISSLAMSSRDGYFTGFTESNCVTLTRALYEDVAGFNEKFTSPGGGIVNLDFFNKINQSADANPVVLLGEATFHQFHGGTATNVPLKDHPWKKMLEEYLNIYGKPYEPCFSPPLYFGRVHPKSARLLQALEAQ